MRKGILQGQNLLSSSSTMGKVHIGGTLRTALWLGQGQGLAPSLQSSPCPWLGPLPLLTSEQPSLPSPSQSWLSHLQLLEA